MDPQAALVELQSTPSLSILRLARPFLETTAQENYHAIKRSSNSSSTDGREGASPAILSADLAHYQDLFSKLRFSYVEQVTKERFLRSITAGQPEFVDANENVILEEKLRNDKASLKEKKAEVRDLVKELDDQGRSLATRYENVQLQTTRLESLPDSIAHLEETIEHLRRLQAPKSEDPALCMPLQPTLDLLEQRQEALAALDRQIEALRAAVPHKHDEVAALQDEVSILNTKKIKAVEEAKEARRRRENGGKGDEIEERGRWLRGVDSILRTMLEV